jgi:hypothetical protein
MTTEVVLEKKVLIQPEKKGGGDYDLLPSEM